MNVELTVVDVIDLIALLDEKIKAKQEEGCTECAERWILIREKLVAEKMKL